MDMRFVLFLTAVFFSVASVNAVDDPVKRDDEGEFIAIDDEEEENLEDQRAEGVAQLTESERIQKEVLERAEQMRKLAEQIEAEEAERLAEEAARKAEEFKRINEEFKSLGLQPSDAYSSSEAKGEEPDAVDASHDWETRDGGDARTLRVSQRIERFIQQKIAEHEAKIAAKRAQFEMHLTQLQEAAAKTEGSQ